MYGIMPAMREALRRAALGFVVIAGFAVAAAFGVEEHLIDEARALFEEAKPFVATANDTDLPMEERRVARKEAFRRLKEGHDKYEKYFDLNPALVEKYDEEACKLNGVLHGIKKDSGLGELEKEKPLPELPGQGAAPSPGAPSPPPDVGNPRPPAPTPGTPEPPAPPDLPERAKRQFAAILDFEKAHATDLPTLQRFYEKFLADFPDPSLPEYAQAAERLGKVSDRIKKAFESVANRSLDSLSGSDTSDEKAVLGRLTQDFSSKDPDVRRRAARILSATRARSATFFLARGLSDKDDELAKICREGLIAIGGTYTGENLVKLYRDASNEKQTAALDVLNEITKKSPLDALTQSPHIGRFVLSNDGEVAQAAISLLTRMGKQGGPGLMCGLDSVFPDKKVAAMRALADARYYKASAKMADRYLGPKVPRELREAALASIEKMGVYTIPWLIPILRSDSGAWTAFVISKITGERFGFNDEKKVRAWWNANKPKDAE